MYMYVGMYVYSYFKKVVIEGNYMRPGPSRLVMLLSHSQQLGFAFRFSKNLENLH